MVVVVTVEVTVEPVPPPPTVVVEVTVEVTVFALGRVTAYAPMPAMIKTRMTTIAITALFEAIKEPRPILLIRTL